ncbi:agamous-like MADS-box protein TM6 isoform X3 [Gossypium raimondii]|uniref:agamous-like MADS-box protein TM6 isoform X3 n=1 Tax=Gossypium raimondii TaxID=29730 RepID=UPI00063ACA57|nr:agamous-like MADS-box protein TM6 isoform X3 [Gossypium raimondii]XP_052487424.1 agamous-like MADS-box protein TM6 isoform X3 [Gossypium raimondii]
MEENYRRLKEINKKLRREIRQRMGGDFNELNINELQALEAKMDSSLLAIRERKPPLKRLLTMFLGTMSSKLEQTNTRKRINYTLYEELDAGDMERTRDVYRGISFWI